MDAPDFRQIIDPEQFGAVEFLTADSQVGVMLAFRTPEGWVGYRLLPETAAEIVHALTAWLDGHAP